MKRFSESEIFKIIKESDAGIPLEELCRKMGLIKAVSTIGVENMEGWSFQR
jgi:hypothetical protein